MHLSLFSALWIVFAAAATSIAVDPGPTFGMDYAGMDYNVTLWHSDPSKSANHWHAVALECETLCNADPSCCAWTYCTPEGGSADPERCCLKNGIPHEVTAATHWTGAPKSTKQQCMHPPGPPYPGPTHLAPMVTNRAPCVQTPNWHDVAGAMVYFCMYLCIYVSMYLCICKYTYRNTHTHTRTRARTHTHARTHKCLTSPQLPLNARARPRAHTHAVDPRHPSSSTAPIMEIETGGK